MRRSVRTSVEVFERTFAPAGPIVEIGSRYEPGWQSLADLRPVFAGREFIGCDIRRGPGVDRLEDAHALSFDDATAGCVLLLDVLEHVTRPEQVIAEAHRVLRPDGVLLVNVPFNYRLHGFPSDYWRFTPSGLHRMLGGFAACTVFALGPRLKPAHVCAVASRSGGERFARGRDGFEAAIQQAFRRRWPGFRSELKARGRDFFGLLLGRAELRAEFFDPSMPGGYARDAEEP